MTGNVSIESSGSTAPTTVPRGAPRRLNPITSVHVDPSALARLTFRRQALCRVGGAPSSTEIVTRFQGQDKLFRQDIGISWCTFASQPDSFLAFFCGYGTDCPVIVKADSSQIRVHTSNPVVIDLCTGSIRVRVATANGTAFGEASASQRGRAHVTIRTTATGVDLRVRLVSPGALCSDPVFRAQRRALPR